MFFSGFDIKQAHMHTRQEKKKQKAPECLERRVIFGVVDNNLYPELDFNNLWLLLEKRTQFKVFT